MRDSATLDYQAALVTACRLRYARMLRDMESEGTDITALPDYFDDLPPAQYHAFAESTLEIIAPAAPYFAAQGFERGWLAGNGDARSCDITPNPWSDFVQE